MMKSHHNLHRVKLLSPQADYPNYSAVANFLNQGDAISDLSSVIYTEKSSPKARSFPDQ